MEEEERIGHGSRVRLRYRMKVKLPDGRDAEKEHEAVIDFVYGVEEQTKSLEKAIHGAKKGDEIQVYIPPAELYGERDKDLIREIPKKGLIKQRVRKGYYYRQIKNGALVSFKVLDIKDDTVIADFNPPLAGVSAILDVEILDVEKATEKEIESAMRKEAKRKIGCE